MTSSFRLLFGLSLALLPLSAFSQTALNFYYGNLHAHTAYSDGNKDSLRSGVNTPRQSYAFARASQHFDFLGISEHNHMGAGMRLDRFAKGLQQADSATTNGQFVALYGMEWGVISTGGHLLVYGYDELIGWQGGSYNVYVNQYDYSGLWRKINAKPGAFATCAHPNNSDYSGLLNGPFNRSANSAIAGIAYRSGPAMSTNVTYANQSGGSFEMYYYSMLSKGYRVGPTYDHDNHNTTFGRTTEGRLVVLAPALTKTDLLTAIKARHFYASDDWNTEVRYTLNGQHIMGASVNELDLPRLEVMVIDGDAEGVKSLQLMRGVHGSGLWPQPIAVAPAGATALAFTDSTLALGDSAYYFALITQPDNDRIITTPIWYRRGNTQPSGVEEPAAAAPALLVWPNPASATAGIPVTVSTTAAGSVRLFDALGRLVQEQAAGLTGTTLSVEGLAPGLYQVQVLRKDAAPQVSKLVVH